MKKSPEFYEYYPKLFHAFFKDVPDKTVERLSNAGFAYYNSVLRLDRLIDDKDFSGLFPMLSLQEDAVKILTEIFGMASPFWELWNLRKQEYVQAISLEKNLRENFSYEKYEDVADKKSSFGKIAIDALFVLSENKNRELYEKLLLSHKYFSAGFQIYDDILDFREDLAKEQFNLAVYELEKISTDKKSTPETLNKLLFIKGIGQNLLKKSVENFQKSQEILSEFSANSLWETTAKAMSKTIGDYLDQTGGYLQTLQTQIELENQPENDLPFFDFSEIKNETLKNGLAFLQAQYAHNYPELQHIMYLGKREGFSNKNEIQVADVFQRAMLADCIFWIGKKYNLNIYNYLENEINYLLQKRRADSLGGWAYYLDVKEIAADIDDLGQIMQLFINAERFDLVEKYCKKPLQISVNERIAENGGIETWIIPKNKQTKIQQKQEFFNSSKWGKGPDVEVVANFVYALYLFDSERYKAVIINALNYIKSQQNENGFWASRWYYGNYYGTYVCLRILTLFKENYKDEVKKSAEFLLNSQNEYGGWENPLNTAFALLSLKLLSKEADKKSIKSAENYLVENQNITGFWNETDFIKPKAFLPYKSKTLTTAFVLKALSV